MKKNWNLTLLASLLLCACNNKPEEVPLPPTSPATLANTIAGKHWFTNAYFIFIEEGEEQVSSSDIRSIKIAEGDSDNLFYSFSPFYCSPEGKIDKYSLDISDGPDHTRLNVQRGIFNLYVSPDETTLRLIPNDQRFADKSIYCNVELRLRSLDPDRIEFDMPMNAVVRQDWAKIIVRQQTTGIRVVWTLMTDEQKEEYHNFESPTEIPLDPIL